MQGVLPAAKQFIRNRLCKKYIKNILGHSQSIALPDNVSTACVTMVIMMTNLTSCSWKEGSDDPAVNFLGFFSPPEDPASL